MDEIVKFETTLHMSNFGSSNKIDTNNRLLDLLQVCF